MTSSDKFWVGADPGGAKKFGICVLDFEGFAQTSLVDHADQAVEFVADIVNEMPSGLGVDSPLWWSSGRSSDRMADQWLRLEYGLSGGQVQAANSLRGAALVQGPIFVQRMRDRHSDVPVTETHPKALLRALNIEGAAFFSRYHVTCHPRSEHERDAIVSAVAAREGFEGRWLRDLSLNRLPSEQDPSRYWLAPVHYFWPEF